jgi:hypothetical protein
VDEPQRDHDEGRLVNGAIRVRVTVKRQDVVQVRKLIEGMITDAIPKVVWDALVGQFGDPLAKLTSWTDPTQIGLGVAESHIEPSPTPTPSDPPPSTSVPPTPSGSADRGGEFCRRWRTYLEWAQEQGDASIDRTRAAIIVMHFQDMRPVAPADLLGDVDAVITTYTTYAEAPEPFQVPLSGQTAFAMYQALLAIDRHCGTNAFPS